MKNQDKKLLLFVIATIVTSLGIGYTLLKGTSASDTLSEVPANSAFDDINFYKCVVDAYNWQNSPDVGYDANLTDEQLESITNLQCWGSSKNDYENIVSAKGLEKLTKLKTLDLYGTKLTKIDVSNNTELISLRLSSNQLTKLDVSKNVLLTDLDANYNQLTSLNVSGAILLEKISAERNALTSLDVTKNTELTSLMIQENELSSLNVSNNTKLTYLNVRYNQLTSLNVGGAISLVELHARDNKLASVDLTKNIALKKVDLLGNKLTKLDVSSAVSLVELNLYTNQLEKIDVSKNTELTYLSIAYNKLTSIDVSNNTKLTDLGVDDNQLTKLDVSKNTELTSLSAGNNKLSNIDVTNNTKLTALWVYWNQLTKLDVGKNINLKSLLLDGNQLTSIDVSKNIALESLDLSDNQLTSLDVTKNTNLNNLSVYDNKLTSIDITNNTALEWLDLSDNQLTSLDITKNTLLTDLILDDNKLTSLDVNKNTLLEWLNLSDNQLTSLDITKNTLLTTLILKNNKIISLDTSNIVKLDYWDFRNNNFNTSIYIYKGMSDVADTNLKFYDETADFEYTYTSSNSAVAKVDKSGIIVGVKKGTTNIKSLFTYCSSDYYTEKCTNINTVNVVEITSNKYVINNDDSYIYVINDTDTDVIKGNIVKSNDNIDIDINNNKLYVKYKDKILKEFNIVILSSDKYDLINDYIYLGSNEIDLSKIHSVNGDISVDNNKLVVKCENVVVEEYSLLSFKVNNYKIYNKKIIVLDEVSYSEFIKNIENNGVTFRLYKGTTKITSGNVLADMVLKIYYDNKEIDNYVITDNADYLEFDNSLLVDDDNINNIVIGTLVDDIISNVSTSGSVSVLDKNNNILNMGSKLKTGDRLKIELSSGLLTYSISVMGDVDGDGDITREDIELSSKHIIKGNLINGSEYLKAIDIDNNDKTNINDIIRMVKKVKGE